MTLMCPTQEAMGHMIAKLGELTKRLGVERGD